MIKEEIKIHSYCNHQYILDIYGVFKDENKLVMITELIIDGTLFNYMQINKKLGE